MKWYSAASSAGTGRCCGGEGYSGGTPPRAPSRRAGSSRRPGSRGHRCRNEHFRRCPVCRGRCGPCPGSGGESADPGGRHESFVVLDDAVEELGGEPAGVRGADQSPNPSLVAFGFGARLEDEPGRLEFGGADLECGRVGQFPTGEREAASVVSVGRAMTRKGRSSILFIPLINRATKKGWKKFHLFLKKIMISWLVYIKISKF